MTDKRALATVRRTAVNRSKSEQAWHKAIHEASRYGCSLREIAAAAGVSHVRVLQILRA